MKRKASDTHYTVQLALLAGDTVSTTGILVQAQAGRDSTKLWKHAALARTWLIIAPCHLGVRVVGLDGQGVLACSANRKQHVCARNGGGSPGAAGGAQGNKRGRNTECLHITGGDTTSSRPLGSSPPQSTPAALKVQYSPAQFQRRASGRLGGLCAGSDPGADLDRLRLLSSHAYAGGGTKDGPMRAGIHFFFCTVR
jgi:hypothetical protein